MAPMSVPFVLSRSPYAANSSVRPPRAAPVAFEAKMMCSPRARSSFVRRSAAAVSVMTSPPAEALGAIDGSPDMSMLGAADAAADGAVVGAPLAGVNVEPALLLHAANTTTAAAVNAMGRNLTGRSPVAFCRRPMDHLGV